MLNYLRWIALKQAKATELIPPKTLDAQEAVALAQHIGTTILACSHFDNFTFSGFIKSFGIPVLSDELITFIDIVTSCFNYATIIP